MSTYYNQTNNSRAKRCVDNHFDKIKDLVNNVG